MLNHNRAMKMYWGVDVQLYAFLSSALDGAVSFTLRPLYSQQTLDMRLDGPQIRSRRGGEEKE